MLLLVLAAATPHHRHLVALIIGGLFLLESAGGYWLSGMLRERRNAIPKYFGIAKYWWVFLIGGATCLFAALVDAAA
jgi:hypothetical protein